MSVVETILVFVLAPASVVAVMAMLIWGRGAARAPRYRPGREWPYEPVWYAPHPLAVQDVEPSDPWVRRGELTAGQGAATGPSSSGPTAAGGARGSW